MHLLNAAFEFGFGPGKEPWKDEFMKRFADEQLIRLEVKMQLENKYRKQRNKEFSELSFEELMAFHSDSLEDYVESLWKLRGVVLSNSNAEKVARKFAQDIVDSSEDPMSDLRRLHKLIKEKLQKSSPEERAFLRSFPRELESAWGGVGDCKTRKDLI